MNKPTLQGVVNDIYKVHVLPNINHQNAEVRKNVIFCLVEMK